MRADKRGYAIREQRLHFIRNIAQSMQNYWVYAKVRVVHHKLTLSRDKTFNLCSVGDFGVER